MACHSPRGGGLLRFFGIGEGEIMRGGRWKLTGANSGNNSLNRRRIDPSKGCVDVWDSWDFEMRGNFV